jgi:hypothetical protein
VRGAVALRAPQSGRPAQSRDEECGQSAGVVAGVALRADAEVSDAAHEVVGVVVGADLAGRGRSLEEFGAHRQEAVEEVGVQRLEAAGDKSLLTLFGAEHSLGGIPGHEVAETTDESPARVALIQQLTTAYLRSALHPGDTSWKTAVTALEADPDPLGKVRSK